MDSHKPLATCFCQTCDDCPVRETLHCHFSTRDLLYFLMAAFPSFLLGCVGIYRFEPRLLVPWLVIIFGFFGVVEIRVMCSHCPHYAEPGTTLSCWANYGSPKLWNYRPGPMSRMEKAFFWGGLIAVWAYPLPFLLVEGSWPLLATYTTSSLGFFIILKMYMCSRCMNFACPLNGAPTHAREGFFARNPGVAGAWGDTPKAS